MRMSHMRVYARLIDLARAKRFRRGNKLVPASDWIMLWYLSDPMTVGEDGIIQIKVLAQLTGVTSDPAASILGRLVKDGLADYYAEIDTLAKQSAKITQLGLDVMRFLRWETDELPDLPTKTTPEQ